MKISLPTTPRGIALIMVMMVIVVLSILAGGFAYSIKVETRLARNGNVESDFEWLGRSGVEKACNILGQQLNVPGEAGYTGMNQRWAGGVGGSAQLNPGGLPVTAGGLANPEDAMPILPWEKELWPGKVTIPKDGIVDLERKFNINLADEVILRQAMIVVGADVAESSTIISSIQDWIDIDDNEHLGGAESDYYMGLTPAYVAKNGPMDDLSELLLVRGVTPEKYWGPAVGGHASVGMGARRRFGRFETDEPVTYAVGLVDLFTTLGATRQVNINTASATILELVFDMNLRTAGQNRAQPILIDRNGLDGVAGTEDDGPIRSQGELSAKAGDAAPYFTIQSLTFEVHVEVQIGAVKRTYIAVLHRNPPRDVQIMNMYWK